MEQNENTDDLRKPKPPKTPSERSNDEAYVYLRDMFLRDYFNYAQAAISMFCEDLKAKKSDEVFDSPYLNLPSPEDSRFFQSLVIIFHKLYPQGTIEDAMEWFFKQGIEIGVIHIGLEKILSQTMMHHDYLDYFTASSLLFRKMELADLADDEMIKYPRELKKYVVREMHPQGEIFKFVRVAKECGGRPSLEEVAKRMEISKEEADRLAYRAEKLNEIEIIHEGDKSFILPKSD